MTWQVVEDLLAQTLPTRVLLVGQGVSRADREWMDEKVDQREDHRVLPWNYLPALPSLSAVWNRALRFVWELGGPDEHGERAALVVNNDVRLAPWTYAHLLKVQQRTGALFVSAVGVREQQYEGYLDDADHSVEILTRPDDQGNGYPVNPGGPDFSCFLLTLAGHWKYPFDESLAPAYTEDVSAHREYMLGGDGARIFSVNIPFLHYASGTMKAMTPEQQAKFQQQYAGVVQRYTQLWGGKPNQETFTRKGDPSSAQEGMTTPDLQRRVLAGEAVHG